jgi:hypothetical protein
MGREVHGHTHTHTHTHTQAQASSPQPVPYIAVLFLVQLSCFSPLSRRIFYFSNTHHSLPPCPPPSLSFSSAPHSHPLPHKCGPLGCGSRGPQPLPTLHYHGTSTDVVHLFLFLFHFAEYTLFPLLRSFSVTIQYENYLRASAHHVLTHLFFLLTHVHQKMHPIEIGHSSTITSTNILQTSTWTSMLLCVLFAAVAQSVVGSEGARHCIVAQGVECEKPKHYDESVCPHPDFFSCGTTWWSSQTHFGEQCPSHRHW